MSRGREFVDYMMLTAFESRLQSFGKTKTVFFLITLFAGGGHIVEVIPAEEERER